MTSVGIALDLLHNYHREVKFSDSGLDLKDNLGPFDFNKTKLPRNPFGITTSDCEHETRAFLKNMIFPSPF